MSYDEQLEELEHITQLILSPFEPQQQDANWSHAIKFVQHLSEKFNSCNFSEVVNPNLFFYMKRLIFVHF